MPDDPNAPKLIIDTDWKAQAQAEKERLAAAEKAKAAQARPAQAPPAADGAAPAELGPDADTADYPRPDFIELVRMLTSQALLYLGAMPDPETGRRIVSLEMGQFHVDMLAMLEEKTKGNLTDQEQKYITRILYELRLQFVEISKAVAKAVEQGKIAPMSPGGPMANPMANPMGGPIGGPGGIIGGGGIPGAPRA